MKVLVDDPDCTFVGDGIVARVDRVKASTLPTANLGVLAVGTASAFSLKKGDAPRWVQVPNTNGWANLGEEHLVSAWADVQRRSQVSPGRGTVRR